MNDHNAPPPETTPAEHLKPYRWKPGQSGNPNGRPKNESLTAKLRRVLESEHNGRPIADLIVERIVKEALSGKFVFAKELLDRLDGLPGKEKHTNEPVRIIVADYRTGAERPGTGDDIRDAMAPIEREGTADDIRALALGLPVARTERPPPVEHEVSSLREFYTRYPASAAAPAPTEPTDGT